MPAQRDPSARRRYRRAVLGGGPPPPTPPAAPLRVLTGTVLDASPHVLALATAAGEARLPMTARTTVWHGGRRGPAAPHPGQQALVRMDAAGLAADRVWLDIGRVTGTILSAGPDTLEVDLGPHRGRARVSLEPRAHQLVQVRHPRLEPGYLVDVLCVRSPTGPRAVAPATSQPGHRADDLASPAPDAPVPATTRGTATWTGWPGAPQTTGMGDGTTFPPGPGTTTSASEQSVARNDATSASRPGGVRNDMSSIPGRGSGTAFVPMPGATSGDPSFSPSDPGPGKSRDDRPFAHGLTRETSAPRPGGAGSGTSFVSNPGGVGGGPPEDAVAYPAVEGEGTAGGGGEAPPGCVPLPLLSVGSGLDVVNDCSGRGAAMTVAECGCVAARFCDRCVECGTSPRGRIVELGPVAFAALGGDLDAGCFNVKVRWGAEGGPW
ncbi:hypothetical protein [Actinomadura oligospora]|uniref:hypothetical protein n=1 Tax=Actinomadura oligospora TaxID=111804 RepID=UPI0004B2374D|nr:hypothetical protein [Actinomadura oligospora]